MSGEETMHPVPTTKLPELIDRYQSEILAEWTRLQREGLSRRRGTLTDVQLKGDSQSLLNSVREALLLGNVSDIERPEWSSVRNLLADLSRQRALQGFTPSETATFVFSLKRPLFDRIRNEFASDPAALAEELWTATALLDQLGLYTTEIYQKSREQVIHRQQQEMLELSTPVVELWKGVLALPLIGTLDSARTQIVMQNLLEAIVNKSAGIAIIDITGVPTVDTLVAQHLLKTVAAARLMGAECIISGIRPQIAQTIIHLGVELGTVSTKATLAAALQMSLRKLGYTVTAS
jgi:rsbT co-antagonist protein RsbR